jgi:alkylhydroperoxidase family enzyme
MTAWRETPFFHEQERAALAWAEAMTELPNGHPSGLTFAIATINALNRVGIGFQGPPQPWK